MMPIRTGKVAAATRRTRSFHSVRSGSTGGNPNSSQITVSRPSACSTSGMSYRLSASAAFTTAETGTSHSRLILCFRSSEIGDSDRQTMASGWMPRLRSSVTECWVGLVFCSLDGPMKGTRVTCT